MKKVLLNTVRWLIYYPITIVLSIPLLIGLFILGAITDYFRWDTGYRILRWWSELFFIMGKIDKAFDCN